MATIKTAISIEKPLFEEVDLLAQELAVPRSHVFVLAAQEFVQRHKSRKLLDALNEVYDDTPDLSEENLQAPRRAKHLKLVKDQW